MDPLSTYDPDREPNPQAWLEIDETERLKWVKRFHVQAKIRMPNVTAHAALHLILENQIALGVECTVGAIARLMGQGLSRHDAIHAVSSVYCEHFYEQAHGRAKDSSEALWASCSAAIERLSAEDWLAKR